MSSSISFKVQILISYAPRFPQNIDFSSIFTHVHIKSIAHIGLSDILLIFHICYWQIGEGQQKYGRRNQTQAAIMEMMLNIPRGSTPRPLDLFSTNVPILCKIDYVTLFPPGCLLALPCASVSGLKLEDAKIGPDTPVILMGKTPRE